MEDLFTQIASISSNFPHIEKAARDAVDFLGIQQGLIRDPPHELREKCLFVIQLCFESRRSKFAALAVAGLQKIIRDDRFHSNIEPNDDSKWLPLQLLHASTSFMQLSDDIQVEILKILLSIACSKKWNINGRTLICILSLCSEAFESANVRIRSAAQAAASQTVHTFCLALEENFKEDDSLANFNEIIPVLQFICSKIDEAESSSHCENGVVFLLECLLTLFSSLPESVSKNSYLKTFFWQKLCPVLISVLGTPKVDKNITTRSSTVEKEHGRGSGGLNSAPSFGSFHAKTIYSINTELVRIFGRTASLRPVLESMFHRVLLYPPPEHRIYALRSLTELLRNPNRLKDISSPMIVNDETLAASDMSLFRLIMDSVEESSKSRHSVAETSVMCCFELLKGIEELCLGHCLTSKEAEIITESYPTLVDCNYGGPKTYESTTRLPQPYRDRLEEEQKNMNVKVNKEKETYQISREVESDSSGETEEEDDEEDDKKMNAVDVNEVPLIMEFGEDRIGLGDSDRQRARHFVDALRELLPVLMPMRSSIQVDQALKCFASQYCREMRSISGEIKAENIYVVVYSTLLLDMRLFQTDYYLRPNKFISITEDDFVTKMKDTCKVSYLSCSWLKELYQVIVTSSILQANGFLPTNNNSQPHALINLLTDVEGPGSYQSGSQMLWECRRLEKPNQQFDDGAEREGGLRLGRQILTCCWDSVLKVLAMPLSQRHLESGREKLPQINFLKNENHCKQIKQLVTISINGLQILTRLCNNLGLQDRSGSILDLLASASCINYAEKKTHLSSLHSNHEETITLMPSNCLSLELILGSGLELGSHCPDCWPHVFRCCIFVKNLEHKYFSKSENRILGTTTKLIRKEEYCKTSKKNNFTLHKQSQPAEDNCVDLYNFLCSHEISQTVSELVSEVNQRSANALNPLEKGKIICILSQQVDRLFEDAALKLNLKSLESFSTALCFCSHEQLFPNVPKPVIPPKNYWWQRLGKTKKSADNTLFLDSIGEILLKSVRSGRPLFHIMRIWSIVVPHLMEASCHKDLTVSRKAVKHLHDAINAALSEHSDLPYFHITEALFKPFENLLCLELCEPDIQDQIVGCVCEFVEANFREIRSGWRPLFGALRAVSTNINTLLDVFRVFLETDNVLVFSYAAVDYIMCLHKHLRAQSTCNSNTEVGFEILKYLKRCQSILSSVNKMPQCVTFQSADHIQVSDGLLVDPVVGDVAILNFDNVPEDLKVESTTDNSLMYCPSLQCEPSLDSIDRPGGVLKVWFLLLEGMHSAAISANSAFQSFLLDTLYNDLGKLIDDPGAVFGLIVFNRLTLPMTQSWLRQLSKIEEADFFGLKQSIGLLSDLVVQYFTRLHSKERCENLLNLLLRQVLVLLSECCIHPIPAVVRIGPSCLRHIITSIGSIFTSEQWNYTTIALHRTCYVTTAFLRQLMVPFSRDSQYYYGDSGQVKVAARRPSMEEELYYSKQLSQHVFLLDEQHIPLDLQSFTDRNMYTFLIHNSQEEIIRIPMKSLVVTLQAHQSTLQVIAELLLQGTAYCVPGLVNVLNKSSNILFCVKKENDSFLRMPGSMEYLNAKDFKRLLYCLDFSYHCALAFDSRPGLKFLIQKVAGLEQAANLYRQACTAWSIKLVSLFEYCLMAKRRNLTIETIRTQTMKCNVADSMTDVTFFIHEFQCTLNEMCRTYVDIVVNNYERRDKREEKSNEPLLVRLTSQNDYDLPAAEDDNLSISKNQEKSPKPFRLSDFANQWESDNAEESDISNHENVEVKRVQNTDTSDWLRTNGQIREQDVELHGLDDDISMTNVLMEYRKKKSNYSKSGHTSKSSKKLPVPPEIEQQRRNSFLKDGEALCRVWTEMLGCVFQLLKQVSDEEFQMLLPSDLMDIRFLMDHATDPILKQVVAAFFQRVDAFRLEM